MPVQRPRTRSGAVAPAVEPTTAPPRGGRRGVPSPPSSPSPPRQEANSRHAPAVAASVHGPRVPEPVPQTPVPELAPSPEAMQAFRAYWDNQDRQPTYQEFRDFMSFWSMYGEDVPTAQPHASAPPRMQSVPLVPAEDSRSSQSLFLSKLLKEARQLGCSSFDGTSDAMVAKEWLKRVIATFDDMVLEEDLRLKVATRLLEGRARVWWESLKGRSRVVLSWSDFQREFDEEYYTRFHRDQKKAGSSCS
ncbi:proline-rich protein 36-like [Dioscorea cayenensis subsp. rotundata]|uniref:Proline-rich protein 36-like n=1 Tax=Dioscorea cayennensis subsp. rotundata TaxID=55577 RepID=A0AB40AVI6_DIOCR|nr:proline-rich protein 36-like [Dioscorea cayenensis subsp. rotundata]